MIVFEDNNGIILRRQAGDEIESFFEGALVHVETNLPHKIRLARLEVGEADSFRPLGKFKEGSGLEKKEGTLDYFLRWTADQGAEPVRGLLIVGQATHYTYA